MLTHCFTVRQTFRSSRASSSALPLLLAFLLFCAQPSPPLPAPSCATLSPCVYVSVPLAVSPFREDGVEQEREKEKTNVGSAKRKRAKKREILARVRSLTLPLFLILVLSVSL